MKVLAARGDVEELEAMAEAAADQSQRKVVQAAIDRLKSKASDVISRELKGAVNREFPGELREKTLQEIYKLAEKGDKTARKAKKLLTQLEYKK